MKSWTSLILSSVVSDVVGSVVGVIVAVLSRGVLAASPVILETRSVAQLKTLGLLRLKKPFLGYAGIPNFHQYKKKLPQKKRQPTMLFKVRRTLWLSVSMPVLSSLFMSACWGFNILQAVWANPKTRLCARARTQAVRTPPNTLWHFHGINVQHDYTFVSRHEIQKWLRPNVLSWIFQGQFDQ